METIFIFLLAIILDLFAGDPPDRFHPVAWLGKLIALQMKLISRKNIKLQLACGVMFILLSTAAITATAILILNWLMTINTVLYIIFAAILLKFTFSIRGLFKAAVKIKKQLQKDNIDSARTHLKALVSRDTGNLEKDQIIAAVTESVAENSCDSFIAPVFYFLIFGIPGAIAYRIINTYDSMIGYHGEWEYFGKFAARFDDVLNYIPARISAFLLVIASWVCSNNTANSWKVMWRDHNKTESPNAGWTMSAIAGALEVRLEKAGHYALGDNNQSISLTTLDSSLKIIIIVISIWAFISIAIQGVIVAAG